MKKNYLYLLLAFFIIGGFDISVNATEQKKSIATSKTASPYLNGNGPIITISELKNIKDDAYVTLEGYIIKKIHHENYLFKDATGEATIEIDDKRNNQLTNVNEKTLVQIYGEYDKEHFETNKIDVKKVTIVQK